MVQKLFPDLNLKNQNWAYLWINSVKFKQFFFGILIRGLSKYSKIKLQTTYFYLI